MHVRGRLSQALIWLQIFSLSSPALGDGGFQADPNGARSQAGQFTPLTQPEDRELIQQAEDLTATIDDAMTAPQACVDVLSPPELKVSVSGGCPIFLLEQVNYDFGPGFAAGNKGCKDYTPLKYKGSPDQISGSAALEETLRAHPEVLGFKPEGRNVADECFHRSKLDKDTLDKMKTALTAEYYSAKKRLRDGLLGAMESLATLDRVAKMSCPANALSTNEVLGKSPYGILLQGKECSNYAHVPGAEDSCRNLQTGCKGELGYGDLISDTERAFQDYQALKAAKREYQKKESDRLNEERYGGLRRSAGSAGGGGGSYSAYHAGGAAQKAITPDTIDNEETRRMDQLIQIAESSNPWLAGKAFRKHVESEEEECQKSKAGDHHCSALLKITVCEGMKAQAQETRKTVSELVEKFNTSLTCLDKPDAEGCSSSKFAETLAHAPVFMGSLPSPEVNENPSDYTQGVINRRQRAYSRHANEQLAMAECRASFRTDMKEVQKIAQDMAITTGLTIATAGLGSIAGAARAAAAAGEIAVEAAVAGGQTARVVSLAQRAQALQLNTARVAEATLVIADGTDVAATLGSTYSECRSFFNNVGEISHPAGTAPQCPKGGQYRGARATQDFQGCVRENALSIALTVLPFVPEGIRRVRDRAAIAKANRSRIDHALADLKMPRFTAEQERGLLEAHEIAAAAAQGRIQAYEAAGGVYDRTLRAYKMPDGSIQKIYTPQEISAKARRLRAAGFDSDQSRNLIEGFHAGFEPQVSFRMAQTSQQNPILQIKDIVKQLGEIREGSVIRLVGKNDAIREGEFVRLVKDTQDQAGDMIEIRTNGQTKRYPLAYLREFHVSTAAVPERKVESILVPVRQGEQFGEFDMQTARRQIEAIVEVQGAFAPNLGTRIVLPMDDGTQMTGVLTKIEVGKKGYAEFVLDGGRIRVPAHEVRISDMTEWQSRKPVVREVAPEPAPVPAKPPAPPQRRDAGVYFTHPRLTNINNIQARGGLVELAAHENWYTRTQRAAQQSAGQTMTLKLKDGSEVTGEFFAVDYSKTHPNDLAFVMADGTEYGKRVHSSEVDPASLPEWFRREMPPHRPPAAAPVRSIPPQYQGEAQFISLNPGTVPPGVRWTPPPGGRPAAKIVGVNEKGQMIADIIIQDAQGKIIGIEQNVVLTAEQVQNSRTSSTSKNMFGRTQGN